MIESWFPKGYNLSEVLILKRVCFAGKKWQIYRANNEHNVLIADENLAEYWFNHGINKQFFGKACLNSAVYYYIGSNDSNQLIPVCSNDSIYALKNLIVFDDAVSFAKSIANTRRLGIKDSLENGIYIEKLSLVLPVPDNNNKADDKIVLGTYLSGGIKLSVDDRPDVRKLMIGISKEEFEQILKAAEIETNNSRTKTRFSKRTNSNNDKATNNIKDKEFSLPGRIELETFFKDYVIDVVNNSEYYSRMGIEFPSPFILQGPPGCGKTYAVEKLIEYLDWPCFYIDSSSIGSSYIHESSKRISKVFDEAIEAAPSVIVIDEMEAFLSNRDTTYQHHLEEVGEFLRRIPEAKNNRVLVIAMTNMISSIDSAIRRKGRFDHILEVGMPSIKEIEMVVSAFLDKIPHSEIDISKVSKSLENYSMADVDFVLRESARLTAKEHKDEITQETFENVIKSLKTKSDKPKNSPGFKINRDN